MNFNSFFATVLVLCALACNFSTVSAAQPTKPNNQPTSAVTPTVQKQEVRYQVAGGFVKLDKVGFTQPIYSGTASLNGLGMKTAGELGIAGKLVYNEYEHTARLVKLHPLAPVYYDTGSFEPLYLGGCHRDGKPWANRLKLVEQPTATPAPIVAPVAVATPTPVPVVAPRPASTPVVQTSSGSAGPVYGVEFKTSKSQVVVVPASKLLPIVAVVDIPKPRVSANGRPLTTDPTLTPADGYPLTQ